MSKTILSYKHRIYPKKSQMKLLNQDIFAGNQVYNISLNLLQKEYLNYCETRDFYNEVRIHQGFPPKKSIKYHWMSDTVLDRKIRQTLSDRNLYCPLDVMQGERKIARKAFKDGFTSEKGMAKFRKSNILHGAFTWANARITLSETSLLLSKRVGSIKIIRERFFPNQAKVKTVRVKKENKQWFAVFTIEFEIQNFEPDHSKTLGMDTNNGHLDFSDGSVNKYPRSKTIGELKKLKNKAARKLVRELEKIEGLQVKQSKRVLVAKSKKSTVSKNFHKTQYKINKIQTKIKNRRKNVLDKVSNEILSKTFDVLFIEDLSIKDMTSKKNDKKSKHMSKEKSKQMRKNILNFSYSTLHMMLDYKAMLIGRLVIKVDPRYTTQACSACGKIQKLSLADRTYNCECGLSLPRDLNSAINIDYRGKLLFEGLYPSCLAV